MRANAKLEFHFFGPFQVEQKVGELSYRLKLPKGTKLHPVFHVSQLWKGAPPPTETVHQELPCIDDTAPQLQVPLQVLQTLQVLRRQASGASSSALVGTSGIADHLGERRRAQGQVSACTGLGASRL
jgi:hypothetical protein